MALQPTRQLHTPEISHTNSSTSQSANHTVHQCAESQMSSNASPPTRQLRVGIPSHAELQRQRITNNDPRRRVARNAVRSGSRNGSRRDGLGRRVDENIHARRNVQMAQLQRTSQRDDHGSVYLAQAALAICILCSALLELIFQRAGRERLGRYAASQRRVVVNVELQQMKERVIDEIDCAVDVLFHAKEELERAAGFIASREGDVRQLTCSVGDVFAGVAKHTISTTVQTISKQLQANIHSSVQAAHGDLLSNAIPLLDKRLLGSLCGGERGVKCKQYTHKEGETAHHHENEMLENNQDVYARSWLEGSTC